MLYFKHSELVDKYHVSLKTVHNWIDAAKQGKVELDLYEKNGRLYIANRPANIGILEQIVEQGKKYRNARFHKVVTPKPYFYDIFNRRQTLDIISNLTIHHEIPRQYNYLDGGATNWDNWLKRIVNEDTPNLLKSSIALLHTNLDAIDSLIKTKKKINVIDIGVGNAVPVKELLGHLTDKKLLNRYIALDISQSMLDIAEKNIHGWYGDKVNFEGYVRDISYERFDDLIVDDMLDNDAKHTVNLVLLLGATLVNFRNYSDVLKVIYGSMGEDDILVYTDKADTEVSRKYFDFSPSQSAGALSPNHKFMLDMLNIDEQLYDVEMGYDEIKRMRYVRVRLKVALTIKFKFDTSERSVKLEKGDTILLLRVWHMTALEIIAVYEKSGFVLLHSNMTKERQYVLTISAIDTQSDAGAPSA